MLFTLLWDIPNNLYRFFTSELKESGAGMLLAGALTIFGGWITAIVDFFYLLTHERIYWMGIDLNAYPINDYTLNEARERDAYTKNYASPKLKNSASIEAGQDVDISNGGATSGKNGNTKGKY